MRGRFSFRGSLSVARGVLLVDATIGFSMVRNSSSLKQTPLALRLLARVYSLGSFSPGNA